MVLDQGRTQAYDGRIKKVENQNGDAIKYNITFGLVLLLYCQVVVIIFDRDHVFMLQKNLQDECVLVITKMSKIQ